MRRRVLFIVASDNGCDTRFGFEDFANLVRKCRIDFDTSIELLSNAKLDEQVLGPRRACFATAAQFLPREADAPGAVAMLARIHYPGGPDGTLVVIKPRMTPDGPADLVRYLADNPAFPQQTTLEQFFDEGQWESYYELGRRIATKVFAPAADGGWNPAGMASAWP